VTAIVSPRRILGLGATLLLASCWSVSSNWYLMDSGYSIVPLQGEQFAVEVHLNQLKQLGGETGSAEFHRFVLERLKWHGFCPAGWEPLPCVKDGSCVQRTSRSVTVAGRCTG